MGEGSDYWLACDAIGSVVVESAEAGVLGWTDGGGAGEAMSAEPSDECGAVVGEP